MAHAGGRPTKYRPEFCQDIIDFFSIEPIEYAKEITTYKDGTKNEKEVPRAAKTPYLIHWCQKHKIHPNTIGEWSSKFPEFLCSLIVVKQLQEAFLAECGLKEAHNAFMSFQALKNVSGWRDKTEQDVTFKVDESMTERIKSARESVARALSKK
jgi:hypothetical protein